MNSDLFRNLINFTANDVIEKVERLFSHSLSFVTSYCSARWSLRIQENNSGRGADIVREEKLQTFPPINCRIAFFKLKSLLRAAS